MSGIFHLEAIDTRRLEHPPLPRLRPRGVPPSLAGREVFRSGDPDDARGFLARFLGANQLTVQTRDDEFAAVANLAELRGVAFAHIEFASSVTVEIPSAGPDVSVLVHTFGESATTVDDHHFTIDSTHGMVTSPGRRVRIHFAAPGSQMIVRIDRERMSRTLSRMLGRQVTEPIVFDPEFDLTAPRTVRWSIAMQLLSAELMTPDSLLQSGVGDNEIESLLASSLLLLQPHNYSGRVTPRPGRKSVVRACMAYIEQHLAERMTTADVAAAVHIGPRSLQQAFHDALGTTPTEYIRRRRLERVRDELLGASVGEGVTVTDTAADWGFTHLGEFSRAYKQRYGETPSQTLRGE
ncbi:AraC family transcriptional regulator [Gordonia sp. PP30]|uniref:AraC family transcriptional regulator n=1 Tax=Gordonia sp. PP30 TaxID=2935861 RepID=UPI001FFEA922|nr:AraC family transcriptional regulator [Gordonia sp. PP30]UQE76466.1 AraC family transcriptional regulator [Gordonia sp. PP30]